MEPGILLIIFSMPIANVYAELSSHVVPNTHTQVKNRVKSRVASYSVNVQPLFFGLLYIPVPPPPRPRTRWQGTGSRTRCPGNFHTRGRPADYPSSPSSPLYTRGKTNGQKSKKGRKKWLFIDVVKVLRFYNKIATALQFAKI
jgi:hypothetical protein